MSTIVNVRLKSLSPISFSNYISVPKKPKELAKDYEERVWRERLHYDKKTGECYIPSLMIANTIREAAKYLSIPIPGKGKETFTKNFDASIDVTNNIPLGIAKDNVEGKRLMLPSDGKVGGTTRVEKIMPLIEEWEGEATIYIYDEIITKEIFEQVMSAAGVLIGMGRFRPRKRGQYGRFTCEIQSWMKK